MSLRDFIPERRLVLAKDGRRFVVRPPTVATFFSALTQLGPEIGIVFEAVKAETSLSIEVGASLFAAMHADGRLARVLSTCVSPAEDVVDAVMADDGLALALATTAAHMTDLAAVAKNINPPSDETSAAVVDDSGVSDAELLMLRAAERFGINWTEVMEWPIAAFLVVVDSFSKGAEGEGKKRLQSQAFSQHFGGSFKRSAAPVVGGPVYDKTDAVSKTEA